MIKPSPSFLQSKPWGELQAFIGKKVLILKVKDSIVLAIKANLPFGFNYLYIPHGPDSLILSNSEYLIEFIKNITKIGKEEKSLFVKIDPCISSSESKLAVLKKAGFKRAPEMQPELTIFIDLNKDLNYILKSMEPETRYAIRTAEKRGVKIKISKTLKEKKESFEIFWKMFNHTMERSELTSHAREYFEKIITFQDEIRTDLYIAETENNIPIGCAIFCKYKHEYVYLYAASEKGYGKYNAPSYIIWAAINEAKKEKLSLLDLWGISYKKQKWSGITKFKKSFGGKVVCYIGAWDLPLRNIWYIFYKLHKRLFK